MSARRLDRMGLDGPILSLLAKAGITTARDLLAASPLSLMSLLDCNLCEVEEIIAFIANRVRPKSSTALSVLQERQARKSFIRTGVEELDLKLKGGLLIGSISEICGPPGMGKSQFCMSCIVQAIDPVKETSGQIMTENMNEDAGGAIYIDTELKFDPARLVQIAVARMPRQYSTKYRTDAEHEVDKLLQKVLIRRPESCIELRKLIDELQNVIIESGTNIVVVDSIASLARKEGLNERDKEDLLIHIALTLKRTAEMCGCVVLVTNQVAPKMGGDILGDTIFQREGAVSTTSSTAGAVASTKMYQPSLGTTWHHSVSTRLILTQTVDSNILENAAYQQQITSSQANREEQLRDLTITKSPMVARARIPCRITSSGIVAITI